MKLLNVDESSKDTFKECIMKDKPTIVLFFADWCPHCQVFKPTWKKVASKLDKNRKIQVAQVEFSNMKNVPKKYSKNVRGYPTLQMFKGGKLISEYNGSRTEKDLETYILNYV